MLARQVGVDDIFSKRHLWIAQLGPRFLPGFLHVGVEKVPDSFGIEFIFAVEVPIEAAMGQASGVHDLFNRSLRKSLLIELMGRGFQYSVSRALFVVWRIRHRVHLRQSAITRTKR